MENCSYIVVDLDGTLIQTDLLGETALLAIKKDLRVILYIPFWLLAAGKSGLKKKLAERGQPDIALLPYSEAVISLVNEIKQKGSKALLASASNEIVVKAVANHLHIFDDSIGSTATINCKGVAKLEAVKRITGKAGISYIGNSLADMPLWKQSSTAYVVSDSKALIAKVQKACGQVEIIATKRCGLVPAITKVLRIHQWLKNLLLFLPLILAHTSTDIPKLINCFIGFVSFSLCSSGFYIINDLLDIEADRKHPSKKRRPFAAGSLSIPTGLVVSMLCLGASTLLGIGYLPHLFVLLLLGYAVITLAYSYWLKEKMLLDVLVLAGLYSIRIIAGGVATDTEISPWLIAFSTFFFLSLALLKRFIEIVEMEKRASTNMKGRGYCVADGAILRSSGIASAFMSIVIFFLYITNSINATIYYPHPVRLWFITPLITYWFLRLWILAGRGIVEDDPVYFAMRDPVSWVVGLLMLGVVAISTF